jgi:hypothetical protein
VLVLTVVRPWHHAEDAPVQQVNPSWSKGLLKGLVDPCALVKPETLNRLIPGAGMQRIADQGYTSGKDMSTATCVWTDNGSLEGMRKMRVVLWYRTELKGAEQSYDNQKERADEQANKTDTIGIQYGSVESVPIGDEAHVQSAVTTTPMGQAVLTMRLGNVVVDVEFSGGDGVNPMNPVPADTVVAEAKSIAQDVSSLLRP